MGFYDIKTSDTGASVNLDFSQVLRESLLTSSVHGFPYLLTGRGFWKKCMWLLLSLGGTGVFIYNFISITSLYNQYNVNVIRYLEHSRNVEFPAVTVCNTNPVQGSKLYLSPVLQSLVSGSKTRKKRQVSGNNGNASYITYRRYQNKVCYSNTLYRYSTYTPCQCSDYCDQYQQCVGFVYKTTTHNRNCYLKRQCGTWYGYSTTDVYIKEQPEMTTLNPGTTPGLELTASPNITTNYTSISTDSLNSTRFFASTSEPCLQGALSTSIPFNYTEFITSSEPCLQESDIVTVTSYTILTCYDDTSTTSTVTSTTTNHISTTTNNITPTNTTTTAANLDGDTLAILGEMEPQRQDFKTESLVQEAVVNMPSSLRQQLGYTLSDLVVKCTFKGRDCYAHDFTYFLDPNHGNCFVFNSGWNWASVDEHSHYEAYNSGPQQGLKLVLNIKQSEYVGGISHAAGAIVVIHSNDRMPFPEDEGILAVPGEKTSISIRKIVQKRLGGKYNKCNENEEDLDNIYKEYLPVKYSINACYKTCYQKYVISKCNCADPQYPMTGIVFGNYNGMACSTNNLTQVACLYKLSKLYAAGNLDCVCPNPCSNTVFYMKSSKSSWPADVSYNKVFQEYPAVFSGITNKSDYLEKNMLALQVYYENLNILYSQEVPAYTFASYMSDFAGAVGLWLGCTLFTLMECLELLADLLFTFCIKARKGNVFSECRHQHEKKILKNGRRIKVISPQLYDFTDVDYLESSF